MTMEDETIQPESERDSAQIFTEDQQLPEIPEKFLQLEAVRSLLDVSAFPFELYFGRFR